MNNNLDKRTSKGGRPKNAPNKVSKEAKEIIAEILNKELPELESRLNNLKDLDRVKITLELLSYITPKLKAVEMNDVTPSNFKPVILNFSNEDNRN